MIFLLVFYLIIIANEIKKSQMITPIIGWIIGLLYFLIIPLTIISINNGYTLPEIWGVNNEWGTLDIDNHEFIQAFMMVWISLMLSGATIFYKNKNSYMPIIEKSTIIYSSKKITSIILISSFIIISEWVIRVFMIGGIDEYFSAHWYTRNDYIIEDFGFLAVLLQYISIGFQIIITTATGIILSNFDEKKFTKKYKILIFSIVMILLNILMTGNRIFFALLIFYFVISLFLKRRFSLLISLLFLSPLAIIIFSVWQDIRARLNDIDLVIDIFSQTFFNGTASIINSVMNVTEGVNVLLLFSIIRDFGSKFEFYLGETYLRTITAFVPRSIYPDRIEGFATLSAKIFEPEANTSINSTALGEIYANFGIFIILLLPLYTLILNTYSSFISSRIPRYPLFVPINFMIFLWLSRSAFSECFFILIISFIIIKIFNFEKNINLNSSISYAKF